MENASAASQGSSAPSTSSQSQSSTPTQGSSPNQGQRQTQPQSTSQSQQRSQPQNSNQGLELVENEGGDQAQQVEEFEEISLGATKGKVPKAIAAAMKEYQRGINQKFQQIAQERQLAQRDPVEYLKTRGVSIKDNPEMAKKLLAGLGVDPYEISERFLAEKLEEMALSPEQKRLKELEEENRKYKETEETKAQREKAEKMAREEAQHSETLRKEAIEAWRESGLPPDGEFGAKIAHTMLASIHQNARMLMQEGYSKEQAMQLAQEKALSPKEAAAKVKSKFTSHVAQVFGQMSAQDIKQMLGEETLKKLRDHDVALVTGQAQQAGDPKNQKRPGSNPASGNSSKNKPMSEQEFREWQEKHLASLKD